MNPTGKLKAIATRPASQAAMQRHEEVEVTLNGGIQGDYAGHIKRRQVTVLAREAWGAACADLDANLPWTTRRANLLVEGISLENTTGRCLQIGEIVLEITGQTAPCSRMDEAYPNLRSALRPEWRGGVTCLVRQGGTIAVGDPVGLL